MGLLCFIIGLVLSVGTIESQSREMFTPSDCKQMRDCVLSDIINELHIVSKQLAELRRQNELHAVREQLAELLRQKELHALREQLKELSCQNATQHKFDHCPPGFTLNPRLKSCYHLSNGKGTWDEAFKMCKVLGAYLVEVQSKEEDDFLRAVITDGTPYWMGANDKVTEGAWEWKTSKKSVAYTHWALNEPNGNRKENCLTYWTDRMFHSAPCTWIHKYICEMKLKQD